jgi:hypothetical protein
MLEESRNLQSRLTSESGHRCPINYPHAPTERQAAFTGLDCGEALFAASVADDPRVTPVPLTPRTPTLFTEIANVSPVATFRDAEVTYNVFPSGVLSARPPVVGMPMRVHPSPGNGTRVSVLDAIVTP